MSTQKKILRTEDDKTRFIDFIRNLNIGNKPWEFSWKLFSTKRSGPQNSLYWMSIADIARGTENNKNHVHEFYLDEFCPPKSVTVGDVTKEVKSTKLLDKPEMKTYWERVVAHAATELGVFCRHPDDMGR